MMPDDDWTKPVFKGDPLSVERHHDLDEALEDAKRASKRPNEAEADLDAISRALADALRRRRGERADTSEDDTDGAGRDG